MYTYQDLIGVGEKEQDRIDFVHSAISAHKTTDLYQTAVIADEYMRQRNRTIMQYQKLLYTMSGEAVPDNYSANYKLCSNFFARFVTQENQFLLGNGVSWENEGTADAVGDSFDLRLQELGREALAAGVAFGFWNLDHLEVFSVREFAPLYDEENGALMAGVRFWRIDDTKPLRATLYEVDGYTDYIWRKDSGSILHEKRPYILRVRESEADGLEIYDGENYPSFPIVPLWGNPNKQSELIGIRENIDSYDLIKSGFADDLDDASQIYWIIQNGGGMDDIDLAKFVDRIKTVKAAVVEEDGASAESHTMEVPFASREALLDRLRADMYEDFMALDTKNIANGAVTATQIRAAYDPINSKVDQYEYQVLSFLSRILGLAGIDDSPSFTRSIIVNAQEEIQNVIASSPYLSEDYVTEKLLTLLGDADKYEEIQREKDDIDMSRLTGGEQNEVE